MKSRVPGVRQDGRVNRVLCPRERCPELHLAQGPLGILRFRQASSPVTFPKGGTRPTEPGAVAFTRSHTQKLQRHLSRPTVVALGGVSTASWRKRQRPS